MNLHEEERSIRHFAYLRTMQTAEDQALTYTPHSDVQDYSYHRSHRMD